VQRLRASSAMTKDAGLEFEEIVEARRGAALAEK
jgi:hypothetical protein